MGKNVVDIENGTGWSYQKLIQMYMINWFSKKIPKQFNIERKVFSTNGKPIYAQEKKEHWPLPHSYTKIKVKGIKDLNAKAKTIHLLREDIGENLHELM